MILTLLLTGQLALCHGLPQNCVPAAPSPVVPAPPVTVTLEDWQRLNEFIAPTHGPLKPWTHLAIGSTMVAHFADISTTAWALGKGGYAEANPVLKPFADDPVTLAIAKGGIATLAAYLMLRLHEGHPRTVIVLGIVQTLALGYVAHKNAQLAGLR
jgi:hypothetical protein